MFCPNCGTQVPDGSAFCSNCGTRLNAPPQPGSQPRPVYQQPQQSGQTPYQQPRQAQPRPVYQQPQQQKSAGAKKAAEKPAKKGGFGKKLVAAALVGTVGFFGVKALLNGLDGGGDPDDDWREGPPKPVPPYSDSYDYSGSGGSGSSGSNGGYSNPGSTGSSDPVFDESGRFKGKSGVGQLAVAEGEAAGLTTEEAAAQDIFYVFQVMDYATKEDSADYESDFFMVKIDEEKGVAYLLESIDDDDPIPCRYDKSSGTLTLSSTEDGDSVDMTLKRQPNGSFSGSASGVVDGENRHAYIALNRITPTKDGRWLSLDSGEVFDDYDLGDLSETELGSSFLASATAYAQQNGYSMAVYDHSTDNSGGVDISQNFTRPMSVPKLSDELIDYYVMVEGQNRIREHESKEAGSPINVSHITLPNNSSISADEFNRRVEEYVKAWAPHLK